MPIHQSFLSFNSGEISPYLFYRSDFAKVPAAAAKMRNFLPMPFGSVSKRPGTQWLAETEDGGANSKAFAFVSSDGVEYILHFTQELLTIYRKDGTVAEVLPFVEGYTFPSDSTREFSIRGLQIKQVNDVAFITHPRVHPLQLVSISDTQWELSFVPFERAPMLDENTDRTKTYTVASAPVAPTWALGATYAVNQKVFTDSEWICIAPHTANIVNFPGGGANWKGQWRRMSYLAGQSITLLGDDKSEVAWEFSGEQTGSVVVLVLDQTGSIGTGGAFVGIEMIDTINPRAVGYVTFGDTVIQTRTITQDVAAVRAELVIASENEGDPPFFGGGSGGDEPENGVDALDAALDLLDAFTDFPDALRGIGFKTDVGQYKHEVSSPSAINTRLNDLDFVWFEFDPMNIDEGETTAGLYASTFPETSVLKYGNLLDFIQAGITYALGTRVSYQGLIYAASETHISNSSNAPGMEDAPWTLLSGGWTSAFASGPTSPGKYYKIAPRRDASDFQLSLTAVIGNNGQYSEQIVVDGAWNFFTFGTWDGTFQVQRSINSGVTWEVVRSYESKSDRNVADKGIEDEPTLLRIQYFHGATGANNPRALLVPETDHVTGYCLMDTYVGTGRMTGIAKTALLSGNTYEWTEGAFDLERGFPRAIALHGSRLWFAGTVLNPVSIWGSRISDFLDFDAGTLDDDGIFRTLAASNHQPIRWLASTRRLFVGTSVGEWVEGSESSDNPITPTNAQFRQYTPIGSSPHQPLPVNDGIFFLGRQSGRLYELGSSDAGNDTYAANDLTRIAEHLTASGISNMAFQQTREPCLWAVTRAGALLSFHYSRVENISAWAMHTTQSGLFRDVIIFPSDEGDDEVFFIIDRGGSSNLERFDQGWQSMQEAGIVGNYVDAAGMEGGDFSVVSELLTPPQDMQIDGGGTQGRRKRANELLVNVYQSFGGGVEYDGQTVDFGWSLASDLLDSAPSLKTQWIGVTLPSAHMDDLQFSIVHSSNHPFTVRAAVLRWNLHEP